MKRWVGVASVFGVLLVTGVLVLTMTNARTPVIASSGTRVPTPTSAPADDPTDTTPATPSGGFGDTGTNPDSTFICAAKADVHGTVVAYMTVAGSDPTSGNALCSDLEKAGPWIGLPSIAAGSYDGVAGCFLTSADGAVTARVYAAKSGSLDVTTTRTLCGTIFDQANVSP
jgi:hypothetical protein